MTSKNEEFVNRRTVPSVTDEQLDDMETQYRKITDILADDGVRAAQKQAAMVVDYVPHLIAEVRRLRELETWVNRMPDAGLTDDDPLRNRVQSMTSLRTHLRNFRNAISGMAQIMWAWLTGKMQ